MNLGNLAGQALQAAQQHADKLDPLIDKAGDLVDAKTGGKFAGAVDKAQDAAKDALRDKKN